MISSSSRWGSRLSSIKFATREETWNYPFQTDFSHGTVSTCRVITSCFIKLSKCVFYSVSRREKLHELTGIFLTFFFSSFKRVSFLSLAGDKNCNLKLLFYLFIQYRTFILPCEGFFFFLVNSYLALAMQCM